MRTGQGRAIWLLVRSALTGALGGLLFGFDTAVIAGTTHALQIHYVLTEAQKGLTVAVALYGTILGAMFSGLLGQRMGSRSALRLMAVLYVVSAAGCAFAGPWWGLLAFRALGGLGIGGSSVLGPVYIAELAPAKWRGRLVGLFQINIVVGILLAYLSNAIVSHYVVGPAQWRWEFGVGVVPAVFFLLLLLSVPQSSRWLVSRNRFDEAQRILFAMGAPDSEAEVDAIRRSLEAESGATHDHLFTRRYRLLIFLAISIAFFNQLSGINAILYYLNDIFRSAGFSAVSANVQAVVIGAANLAATLVGISLIDKVGRKTLLLIGAAGDAVCLAGVAVVYGTNSHQNLLLPLLIGFIVFFAISQGAVIWVYLSEVFPTNVRSKGQSLGSSSHWVMNAAIATAFPVIAAYSRAAPFWFFAGMMVVEFVVVLAIYPETKGYSLEAMSAHLGLH
ncbi:MAG TPA: sugar porter family MFS transporter [Acidobacteriaceae bacterium]